MTVSRRDFHRQALGSLVAYGLIESLFNRDLLAADVKPEVGRWLLDLHELGQDLKGQKLKDTEFQAKLEELYGRVDLPALLKRIDFDKIAETTKFPDNGAGNLGFDLGKIEGVKQLSFGKQIFTMKKGRSVVPHGHDNMCTGFLILRGDFQGRHYDRVEDNKDHYLIKPTIDRAFKPGETSTVSDHKDNVHWFTATGETGFIFNIHVIGYDPTIKKPANRVYVDPDGEKVQGGLIKAMKMSSSECHKKYG
jgi:hypothetical protein